MTDEQITARAELIVWLVDQSHLADEEEEMQAAFKWWELTDGQLAAARDFILSGQSPLRNMLPRKIS